MRFDPTIAWDWLQANAATLATTGVVLAGLLILVILGLGYRSGGIEKVAKMIAIPLVVAGEMEGMYELLHDLAGLPVEMAVLLCGMTSATLAALMAMAHKHYLRHGVLGPNKRTLIYVGGTVGVLVAGTASTWNVAGLRVLVPLLGIILLIASYRPDEPPGASRKVGGSWVWTPRRIAARLGWIAPGDGDIVTLHHERGVRQLVRAQYALRYGWLGTRSWRANRVRRIARNVTEEMAAQAYEQMARIERVVEMTAPGYVPAKMTAEPQPEQATEQDEDEPLAERPVSSPPAPPKHPVVYREVAKVMARNPDIKPAGIADRLDISDSTARRYYKQIKEEQAAKLAAANGTGTYPPESEMAALLS